MMMGFFFMCARYGRTPVECASRRKLIAANEAKRYCIRVTECGEEAWRS